MKPQEQSLAVVHLHGRLRNGTLSRSRCFARTIAVAITLGCAAQSGLAFETAPPIQNAKKPRGSIFAPRPSALDEFVVREFLDEIHAASAGATDVAVASAIENSQAALATAATNSWTIFLEADISVRARENELLDRLNTGPPENASEPGAAPCTSELRLFWKEHARICAERLSRASAAVTQLHDIAQSSGISLELSATAAQRATSLVALEMSAHAFPLTRFLGLPASQVEFATVILSGLECVREESPDAAGFAFRAQHDLVRDYEFEMGRLAQQRVAAVASYGVNPEDDLEGNGVFCVRSEARKLLHDVSWDVYLAQRRWLLAFTSSLDPQLRLRVESKLWSLFVPEFIPDDTCAFAVLDAFQSALSTDPAHSDELLALSDWYRAAYGVAMRRLLDARHQRLLSQFAGSATSRPDREEAGLSFDDALAQRERLNQQCLSRMRPFVEGFDASVVDAVLGVIAESSRSSEAPTAPGLRPHLRPHLREKLEARIAEFSKNAASTLRKEQAQAESDRRNGRALPRE